MSKKKTFRVILRPDFIQKKIWKSLAEDGKEFVKRLAEEHEELRRSLPDDGALREIRPKIEELKEKYNKLCPLSQDKLIEFSLTKHPKKLSSDSIPIWVNKDDVSFSTVDRVMRIYPYFMPIKYKNNSKIVASLDPEIGISNIKYHRLTTYSNYYLKIHNQELCLHIGL